MPKLLPSELLRLYRLLVPLPHLHLMTSRQPSLLSPPPRLPFELQSDPNRDRKQDREMNFSTQSSPLIQASSRQQSGRLRVWVLQLFTSYKLGNIPTLETLSKTGFMMHCSILKFQKKLPLPNQSSSQPQKTTAT